MSKRSVMKDLGWIHADDALGDPTYFGRQQPRWPWPPSFLGEQRPPFPGGPLEKCPRCAAILPVSGKWWWHVHFLVGGLGVEKSETSGCFPSEVLIHLERMEDPSRLMEAVEDFVRTMGSKGARYFVWYPGLEIDLGEGQWRMELPLSTLKSRWEERWGLTR